MMAAAIYDGGELGSAQGKRTTIRRLPDWPSYLQTEM